MYTYPTYPIKYLSSSYSHEIAFKKLKAVMKSMLILHKEHKDGLVTIFTSTKISENERHNIETIFDCLIKLFESDIKLFESD